jgi:hypothetical protein
MGILIYGEVCCIKLSLLEFQKQYFFTFNFQFIMKTTLAKIAPTKTKKLKYLSLNKSIQELSKNGTLALFVSGSSPISLVFAPVDNAGVPDLENTVSLELPCKPYCNPGDIQVITV